MHQGPPHFFAPDGEFEVDFRRYDGAILLGEGDWLFRTKWSNARDGTIHTYSDGGSQVAVAPKTSRIEDVSPDVFLRADLTSRTRTPQEGEVVLWVNSSGYAAAGEILRVRTTPESEPGTVLKVRYRILTEGGRDFTSPRNIAAKRFDIALSDALRAFGAVTSVEVGDRTVGVGHNQPPEAMWLLKDDYEALAASLREALNHPAEEGRLAALLDSVGEAAKKIAAGVIYRMNLMQEGFYQQLGAAGAVALMLAGWLLLLGKLQDVGSSAAALGSALFGWSP